MDNWHTAQCARPDVTFVPDLGVPVCGSCGEICPPHNANKDNDELHVPSAGRRSAMQLKWPPSMTYQNYAYSDDPDGSLHKSLASLVDRGWCDKETGKHSPGSSVVKTAQTPAPQVSKTSYESLHGTEIRVVRLHKGRFGDCLRGDFEIVSLQNQDAESEEPETISSDRGGNAASYEAVSYTWAKGNGKRDKDHVIFIGNRWDILPITENCYDALQNCRFDDQDRRLWVDAICINQSKISERTHQVGMMRRIYSTASRVLIYLGMDDTGSGSELTHDPEILSDNPYFSRIWVVQEIASANQALVLYHRQAMLWSFFHRNLQGLSSKRWMRHFGSAQQIDDAHSFLTLLEDTRNCSASDSRDKIFALLGLWKKRVEPDYTLSPQAVYTGLASALVTDESWEVVAQLLDMATHGRSMLGLPSWVPDWSEKSRRPHLHERSGSFPHSLLPKCQSKNDGRIRVHGQTGSLCIQAAEIDIMKTYLLRGFRPIANGMVTVEAGCFQVSLAPEVLQKCEPTDSIFQLSKDTFCLILRKMADPNVYSFIGLCKYSKSENDKLARDAIRYLMEWDWLLSRPSWDFSTWTNIQACWLTLGEQKKLETRLFLQRVVRKAQFLQKMHKLAKEAQQALSSDSGDKQQKLMEIFKRQSQKTYNRWQQEDKLLVVNLKARRASMIRDLLPGYKSLEPSPDNTQVPLGQSMWLPVSFHWTDRRPTQQRLLVECVSRNIPLPPLHLRGELDLCLKLGLENGLRQLQRLAQELSLRDVSAYEKALDSYEPESYRPKLEWYRPDFKEAEWAIFLRWLSKPTSPSYEMLEHGSRRDAPLIWEGGIETRAQLDEAHNWLDNNFNRYLEALSSSHSSEPPLIEIFKLIYREQFELLWMFLFHPLNGNLKESRVVPRDELGAQFARCFFWRFERSMKKAYEVLPEGRLPHHETKELWAEFLIWITQRSFEEQAPEIPSEVYDDRPRSLVDEKEFDTSRGELCLTRMRLEGVLDEPKTQEASLALYRLTLPELVQSEIWRRRLPERVFSFIFEDTETTPQPTQSDRNFEEMLTHGQPYNCGGPSVQGWRQDIEQWKVVEEYISESEWHISYLMTYPLRKREEEIVII